jgi:type IV secretion system protein TrbL
MNDLGVIDRFLNTFSLYIDSGFGLLGGEIAFLTATLIALDLTLAGLAWAMGGAGAEDVIARLIKKTLYIGAFAFILNNFAELSSILFRSFAGLGLTASGSTLTEGDLLRPGRLASVGVEAARPILNQIGELMGFPDFFLNLDSAVVLFIAWLIVIVSFFILSVQMFVTLIEFKLTTLAGFVLVPFALWGKTAFLAERVLGNVISSGIKVLVLAVIVGIGMGLFGEFTVPPGTELTIDHALAIMLASLALFGLGLFGPSIATGLVSGGPQLGAGTAAGTMLAAGGLAVAGATAAAGTARLAGAVGGSVLNASGPAAVGTYQAAKAATDSFNLGAAASSASGAAAASGLANVVRAGGRAAGQTLRAAGSRAGQALRERVGLGGDHPNPSNTPESSGAEPDWARRMRQRQAISHGIGAAAQVMRTADHPGGGASPSLKE